jgi:arylsulfatase A-like enzyme
VDVLPSLARLLGLPLEDPAASGTPLFALDAGAARPVAAPRALVAEMLLLERNVVRAVIRDDWKYVEAHRWLDPETRARSYRPVRRRPPPPPLPASAEPVHRALYDLARDPDEQHDRLAEQPERARALAALLEREAPLVAGRSAAPAPLVSREEQERLRALGYH